MFNSNLCDRIIDIGLPACKRPQTVPACLYDSTKKLFFTLVSSPTKIAGPADCFLDLGRLGLVLEPLVQAGVQGRSAAA